MHLLWPVFLSVIHSAVAVTSPTVTVLNGTLSGALCPSTDVNSFFSIPFANPPVGDLRFAPPQPYDRKYDGVLKATTAAPACPQFNTGFNSSTPESENCLYLDVWAPANATASSKLPVRVWVYGGADESGDISVSLYDGCFGSTDTIQVSLNYRVGPLGFLVDESIGLKGNYGIQDLLLGLQWVQDNIAFFGGDPTRVMIFGQSAGAANSRIIAGLPQATSLVHAAVLESGDYAALPNLTAASQGNAPYIASLNCSTSNVTCLRSTPVQTLVTEFLAKTPKNFGLVLDGTTIPSAPTHPLVPSIIGSTTNEGTLFFIGQLEKDPASMTPSDYVPMLESLGLFTPADIAAINETYPVSLFAGAINPTFAALSAVLTYSTFRCPAQQVAASAAAAGVPVWTYSYGHQPSCAWYTGMPQNWKLLEILGASHASELAFVFGEMTNMPQPNGTCNMTADEVRLSATMRANWDSMAAVAAPVAGWPTYNVSASMGVNVLNSTAWEVGTVNYSMCAFWDNIIGSVVGGPVPNLNGTGNSNQTGSSTGSSTGPKSGGAMLVGPSWTCCMLLVLAVALERLW